MTLYDEFDQFQCLACAEGEFLWWDKKVDADGDLRGGTQTFDEL